MVPETSLSSPRHVRGGGSAPSNQLPLTVPLGALPACREPAGGGAARRASPWRSADTFVFGGVLRCLMRAPRWWRAVAAMRLVSRHWRHGVSQALPAVVPRVTTDASRLATVLGWFPHVQAVWLAAPESGMPTADACALLQSLARDFTQLRRLFLSL